jgi:hypothetical protein
MRDGVWLARGAPEWGAAWRRLSQAGFMAPSAPDPLSGEDWQYMGTWPAVAARGVACKRCDGTGRVRNAGELGGFPVTVHVRCSWCGGRGAGVVGSFVHQFRHRAYPSRDGGGSYRLYVNVPASEGWRPESRGGSEVAS